MQCAKKGCLNEAESGSNYCDQHSPLGKTKHQLRDEPKPSRKDLA